MRILGLDFGSWSIKAVEMESRFRRFEVLDFHEVRLPLQIMDPVEAYKSAYRDLIARLPSHPEKVVTSLLPTQVGIRFLTMPTKKRKQVEKMYRFQLEDSIPFKLDETIVEHYVNRIPEGSLVMAAMAPTKLVQTQIEWFKNIGVDPDWLVFDGMGTVDLFLAASALNTVEPQGPVMLLDLGHQKTNLSIYDTGRLEFFRSLSWGGGAVSRAIAINNGVSLEEAEEIKMIDLTLAAKNEEDLGETTKAALASFTQLTADINHSIVGYRNQYKKEISAIRLIGGTSKIQGIERFMQDQFKIEASHFNAFSSVKDTKKQADERRFAEVLGRAMVFARKSALLFNFRQADAGKGTSLKVVTGLFSNPIAVQGALLGGILAFILYFHVFVAGYLAEKESKVAIEELRKVFTLVFPNVNQKLRLSLTANPKDLKKFVQQKNTELEQKLKTLNQSRTPVLGIIRTISDSFPPELKVDVNVVNIDDRNFSLDGVLYSGELNTATEALKRIKQFSNVVTQQDGQRFNIKGNIAGR